MQVATKNRKRKLKRNNMIKKFETMFPRSLYVAKNRIFGAPLQGAQGAQLREGDQRIRAGENKNKLK